MGRYKPQKSSKRVSTARRTKDIDQIWDEINRPKSLSIKNRPLDPDLPGLGQYYCEICARYFQNRDALTTHGTSKGHKKRIKLLQTKPYSHDDFEKIDNGPPILRDENGNLISK